MSDSCYHCDAREGRPHMVGCPSEHGSPWDETTRPNAPTSPPADEVTPLMSINSHAWEGGIGADGVGYGAIRCGSCGMYLSQDPMRKSMCPGPSSTGMLLSASGDASGWRQVRPGAWVYDA